MSDFMNKLIGDDKIINSPEHLKTIVHKRLMISTVQKQKASRNLIVQIPTETKSDDKNDWIK